MRKYIPRISLRRFATTADSQYIFSPQPVIQRGITVSEPKLISSLDSYSARSGYHLTIKKPCMYAFLGFGCLTIKSGQEIDFIFRQAV